MDRRLFSKKMLLSSLVMSSPFTVLPKLNTIKTKSIRLGGPVFIKYDDPGEWIEALNKVGYRSAYCPVSLDSNDDEVAAYREAAKKADIIVAEVGAWSNPISPDEKVSRDAINKCVKSLELADKIAANCCVNISGSRNREHWAGPHPDNLNNDTFDLVVEITRKIIDAVNPSRTYFALETMPWSFPHSVDSYVRLVKAIDRKQFAVHLDPVNLVTSPEILFNTGKLIREFFMKLGPFIRSCHAKDVYIREDIYMPNINETRPGLGVLDYKTFLAELSKLPDIPLMMEHLETGEEYELAAAYIRATGQEIGIKL